MREMIFAMDCNGAIGAEGQLGFSNKEDMAWFKWYTSGKKIVMGWATFVSLGCKPLPDRENFVLTRDADSKPKIDGVYYVTLEDFLANHSSFCVIGGASVYNQLMYLVDRVVCTHLVDEILNADSFIEEVDLMNLFTSQVKLKEIQGGCVCIYEGEK